MSILSLYLSIQMHFITSPHIRQPWLGKPKKKNRIAALLSKKCAICLLWSVITCWISSEKKDTVPCPFRRDIRPPGHRLSSPQWPHLYQHLPLQQSFQKLFQSVATVVLVLLRYKHIKCILLCDHQHYLHCLASPLPSLWNGCETGPTPPHERRRSPLPPRLQRDLFRSYPKPAHWANLDDLAWTIKHQIEFNFSAKTSWCYLVNSNKLNTK